MTHNSIADRIVADSEGRLLIDLLRRQALLEGNESVACRLAGQCEVLSLPPESIVIRQGDADNDIYFILSGKLRIFVNEREVAARTSGQHIGEMALVDAACKRTATVVTAEHSVLARVSELTFVRTANANPFLWRNIATELVRRLDERQKFHQSPNPQPILFIGSSREALPLATALAAGIPADVATVRLWSEGVFGTSHFPIEDLATLLQCADYAAIVASPDDIVTSRGSELQAPRDNIVFELGLFMGALSRHRTFLVVPSGIDIKIPTDLLGINTARFDPSARRPQAAMQFAAKEIAVAIRAAGPR
jgi:CRP/FNR family transcriptional regulator, cyclic AMP receptor protein